MPVSVHEQIAAENSCDDQAVMEAMAEISCVDPTAASKNSCDDPNCYEREQQ
jgi:hypothetical protein